MSFASSMPHNAFTCQFSLVGFDFLGDMGEKPHHVFLNDYSCISHKIDFIGGL